MTDQPGKIRRLLIIRLSALGDVAMTVPVVVSFCRAYPDVQVDVLTSPAGARIYDAVASDVVGLRVRGVDVKRDYRGIAGLNRLADMLAREEYDAVADMHDVLRTKWLRLRLGLHGVQTVRIDKGRDEKRALTRGLGLRPLKSGHERYREVLLQLGFDFQTDYDPLAVGMRLRTLTPASTVSMASTGGLLMGIAPFAQHRGKVYPGGQMQEVIRQLIAQVPQLRIILLGGPADAAELDTWCSIDPERIQCAAGRQSLADDLRLMAHMACVVSMDSSNMHLASLVGTPVVSIWGATHPDAGFLGYRQDPARIVQLPLSCRPCSIYGNKPCAFGSWDCIDGVRPEIIVRAVTQTLAAATPHPEL